MLLEVQSPIQEFPRKILKFVIGKLVKLIEAHNPYEPMLCKQLGDELRLACSRNNIRDFQWAVAGAELRWKSPSSYGSLARSMQLLYASTLF